MAAMLLRRLRDLIIILLLVGTILFFMVRLIPGDPAQAILGTEATEDQLAQLREVMGLTGPLHEQYLAWLGNTITGDLGYSLSYNGPVLGVLMQHIGPTLLLAALSTLISFTLAVLLTVWMMSRPTSRLSKVISSAIPLGLSVPNFWIASILVWVFALQMGLFPTSGYVSLIDDPLTAISALTLPVATLAMAQTTQFTLILRDSVLSEMPQLYLRTARAKGLSDAEVVRKHVLPNALLPTLTAMGLDFAVLVGGVVVIEAIFVIPGLGTLMLTALNSRDFVLLQGAAMLIAFLFVLVNLLVDIAYRIADPRVRVS